MRWRPWIWLSISLLCFLGAAYFWHLGDEWAAQKKAASSLSQTNQPSAERPKAAAPAPAMTNARLLSQPDHLSSSTTKSHASAQVAYRLSNTTKRLGELARSDKAILLQNALLDTGEPANLAIPEQLRAKGDPGAYIVQARGPIDNAFRALLKAQGATVVAYVPNNGFLVRAPEAVSEGLASQSDVQAVVPYEPYYKLQPSLLALAVQQKNLPDNTTLNLLLFADAHDSALAALQQLGAQVLSEDRSPFGPVVRVQPPVDSLPALAGIPGVHEIELARTRVLANDLSRAAVGVAADSVTPNNYLDLQGLGVMVAVSDTGVDSTHPDLANRVLFDVPAAGLDTNGHGTHVAGTIAGDGTESTTVTNAEGSIMPGTNGQFRGMAPQATLFSMDLNRPDFDLQQTAARTNAVISNNSWTYGDAAYDLAAASY
ncbi:MAG TPA: S8 family serine peptidase, partial [Verrucomicrobiae bacterium]|nr:S8 family serine peptidase [Verrucomicrobiae bacterium]